MLAFRVTINGQSICTASSDSVVSAISTLKGAATVGGSAPPDFQVGGITAPHTHATWYKGELAVGDKIEIEVVDVPASALTAPVEVREMTPELVETEQRAYYERLTRQYEPASA